MSDISPYISQRRDADRRLGAQESAYQFSRNLSKRRGARNEADFTQAFKRQLPEFQGGFGRRGMQSSGFYRQALGGMVGDYTRDLGRLREDNASQLAELDMGRSNYQAEYDAYISNLEANKARTISDTARYLAMLKPYYQGGY